MRDSQEKRICKHENCNNEFIVYKSSKKNYCCKKCSNTSKQEIEKKNTSLQKTIKEKYNGVHYMALPEVQLKHKKTMKQLYGADHALQNTDILKKMKDTITYKYDGWSDIIKKGNYTRKKLYGSHNNNPKRRHNIYINKILNFKHVTPLFSKDEFIEYGTSPSKYYPFKCNECGHEFKIFLSDGYIPKCKKCAMRQLPTKSRGEIEVYEFIKELLPNEIIEQKNYSILKNLELDIYLPNKNIAIEYNGIIWHSEIFGKKDPMYHLNKTNSCEEKGIQLLHIYDYHWDTKRDIIKSIIKSKIGVSDMTIQARKCCIQEISSTMKKEFLDANHLNGDSNSSKNIGLFYNDELIAVTTFGRPRYDKKYQYELIRYCPKINTTIIGGFNRLLKYFIKIYQPKNILTYSDRNLSKTKETIYDKAGFNYIGTTKPNYFYVHGNHFNLFPREQFQKHKLKNKIKIFNKELTEWENMQLNGYDRLWGTGNLRYVLELN